MFGTRLFALSSRTMVTDDSTEEATKLIGLRAEHRALDEEIERLTLMPPQDELLVRRLKKRKLQIKDHIATLEARLEPDEFA